MSGGVKRTNFIVISVGTYEHVLGEFWAWRKDEDTVLCKTIASFTPHIASITAMGASGHIMVSGSADETLHVYDLVKQREIGRLDKHKGTITAIELSQDCSHMLTTAEDRTLGIWRTKDWECTSTIEKIHGKGGAISLTLHPSGKAALTLGNKGLVRLWDLVRGQLAAAFNDDPMASAIMWDRGGDCFFVAAARNVFVKTAQKPDTARAVLKHTSSVLTLQSLEAGMVAAGCSDGKIYIWKITSPKKPVEILDGHTARIRAMAYLPPSPKDSDADATLGCKKGLLLTTSTDGVICLWSCDDWSLLTSKDCKLRIQAACLATIIPTSLPSAFFVPEFDEIDDVDIKEEPMSDEEDEDEEEGEGEDMEDDDDDDEEDDDDNEIKEEEMEEDDDEDDNDDGDDDEDDE